MTEDERERFAAGGWRHAPRVLVDSQPKPLSALESYILHAWRRLSLGRRSGAMGAPGNIPWTDVQEFLDREGVTDVAMRELIENAIYRMDQAAQTHIVKSARKKD